MKVRLDKIPGLQKRVAAAAAEEERLRRLPFLPVPLDICGVPVRHFTPRHFLLLDEAGSPFFHPGPIGAADIAQFLWVVSAAFRIPTPLTKDEVNDIRDAFLRSIARKRVDRLKAGIDSYIEKALFDRPDASGTDTPAVASFAALLVDDIATAYGWPDEVLDADGFPIPGAGILDKPFARLLQYRRLIAWRLNPRHEPENRLSSRVEMQCVREFLDREKRKATRKKKSSK